MLRRVVALLLTLLAAGEAIARCGVERWHVKTGIDPAAGSVKVATPVSTTIGKLIAIPRQHVDKNLPLVSAKARIS